LEWPEPPGDDVADNAGEFLALPEDVRVTRLVVFLLCSFNEALSSPTTGEFDPELVAADVLRRIFITPFAMDGSTGTTTAPPVVAGAEEDSIEEDDNASADEDKSATGCCCAALSKFFRKLCC
jgi:hypothetical protein